MYMPVSLYRKFARILTFLRWLFGILLIFAGLDKFLELIDLKWADFVSDCIQYSILPKYRILFIILSLIQILIGCMLLRKKTARMGAYLAGILLIFLSVYTFFTGVHFSRALWNITIGLLMLVIAQLLSVKEGLRQSAV